MSLVYANTGVIVTRCTVVHNQALTILVDLFERADLQLITAKTKCIAFLLGKIML